MERMRHEEPAHRGEERADRIGIAAPRRAVPGEQFLGRRAALEHDRGRPDHRVEGGVANGAVRPVDEDDAVSREQHVVGADVAVHQGRSLAGRGPAGFQLGELAQVDRAHGSRPAGGSSSGGEHGPAAEVPALVHRSGSMTAAGLGVSSSCMAASASTTSSSSAASHGWRGGRPSTASKARATQSPSSYVSSDGGQTASVATRRTPPPRAGAGPASRD